jgi:hypothetical protein
MGEGRCNISASRGAPEGCGAQRRRPVGWEVGRMGPDWKWASFGGNKEKRKKAAQGMWAKIVKGYRKIFFRIVLKDFDSKQRVLKHFQMEFELKSN